MGGDLLITQEDTGINQSTARELQKLKDMISSVPGVIKPIPELSAESHNIPRFAPPICDAKIPKRFTAPSMKLYDGSTDPEEYVALYRERMEINPIPERLKEACLCKGFGSTLTGSALKWLLIFQPRGESLRQFLTRFGREALEISNLDVPTFVEAFKMGLQKDSPFYQDLVMTPCRNLDEVRNKALRFIRLEEDQRIKDQLNTPEKSETQVKKQGSYFRNNDFKPYSKPNGQKINAVEDEKDDEDCPRISDYYFSADIGGVMLAVRSLGDKARWPRKNEKAPPPKDKSKWCAFHEDFGHMTEDCIALRREIGYLLSKGYLKELFGRKKSRT
ncbi:uncharacterized protein LOC143627388 [Bidens hawaiensis]|uniref:uncharacterized protein LOC143627388 n=1 Tax=Bidens hawaiensis TaxID=980011 RepID=UPI00404B8620